MIDTRYMKKNKWTQEFIILASQSYEKATAPELTFVENGYILPARNAEGFSWGIGGVEDNNKNFVRASSVGTGGHTFGGSYSFNDRDIDYLNEPVVFIGIVPNHWGHFLIDTVSRFWPFLQEKYRQYKVAFCGWGWQESKIGGNFLKAFELMGISEDKLLFVDHPVKVTKIIIPEATMEFGATWNKTYRETVEYLAEQALKAETCSKLQKYEKIYFTRTKFLKSKLNEIGEKEIETLFASAGFHVMSPEKMSLVEQIFYIRNCRVMASMSGTIPHNSVFAREGMKLVILNRTPIINPPQIRINQLTHTDWIYVDVYTHKMEMNPTNYGDGPIQIEINDLLLQFFEDNGLLIDQNIKKTIILLKIKNQLGFYELILLKKFKNSKAYSQLKKIYEKEKIREELNHKW